MAIEIANWSYSSLGQNAVAQRLASYIASGAGTPTVEYHELGGDGLLCTFVLNDPEFTVLGGALTMSVSPEVSAVVGAGLTNSNPTYYYLKNGDGNVVGEGQLVVTAAEQVSSGDVLTFSFAAIDIPT